MFTLKIDDELELQLARDEFAPLYVRLLRKNYDYLNRWLIWPPHCQTEADFLEFIQKAQDGFKNGDSLTCGIIYQGELVGNASFNSIDRTEKQAEIGYWLAAEHQGKGIISRVCKALINYAFDELALDSVKIWAAEGNKPSRAVCERLGMTFTGIIPNAEDLHGTMINRAEYLLHRNDR